MKSAPEYLELTSGNRKVRKEGAENAEVGFPPLCVSREGEGGEFMGLKSSAEHSPESSLDLFPARHFSAGKT
jgi:hypothetical protein